MTADKGKEVAFLPNCKWIEICRILKNYTKSSLKNWAAGYATSSGLVKRPRYNQAIKASARVITLQVVILPVHATSHDNT